jgi:hypothetical protein
MRVYTASSWKNESAVKAIAKLLRSWGHEVYCYAEDGDGQVIFKWLDVVTLNDDGITCLDTEQSRGAFAVDKRGMDWAECCLLINPCGRDAHLEAGYMKGCGKKLFILGLWPKGEFSNMYHLADNRFRFDDLGINALREALNDGGKEFG